MFNNIIGAFVHEDATAASSTANANASVTSSSIGGRAQHNPKPFLPALSHGAGNKAEGSTMSNGDSVNRNVNIKAIVNDPTSSQQEEPKQKQPDEEKEQDDDALAGDMLVQFPTYGTQSQAYNTSTQWQEKTADWLLGGHNVPTPAQQFKQQQLEQLQKQQQEEKDRHDRENEANAQKVSFKDWAEDEQNLWRTKRFSEQFEKAASSRDDKQEYKLKEYDVSYEKPVLEDPSRDILAAYYFHTGVYPQFEEKNDDDDDSNAMELSKSMQQRLPRTKVSPFIGQVKEQQKHQQHSQPAIPNIPEDDIGHEDSIQDVNTADMTLSTPAKTSLTQNGKSLSSPAIITEDVAWMPDRLCKTCYSCDLPFTFLRRRHHCRICGQVFCNACSSYFVPAAPFQQNQGSLSAATALVATALPTTPMSAAHRKALSVPVTMQQAAGNNTILRTCKMCYEQVMAQQKKKEQDAENAAAVDAAKGKRRNKDDPIPPPLPQLESTTPITPQPVRRPPTDEGSLSPSLHDQLKLGEDDATSVLKRMSNTAKRHETPFSQRRLRINEHVLEEEAKEETSQLLGKESRSNTRTSSEDISALSPKQHTTNASSSSLMAEEARTKAVSEGNRALGMTAASQMEQMAASLMETDAPLLWNQLKEKNGLITHGDGLNKMQSKWVDKLMELATRCCATVSPNIKRGDLLDIRPYVKIKVIPGGSYPDCAYVSGIVFRKTGTNKQMPREIIKPRIMVRLWRCLFIRITCRCCVSLFLEYDGTFSVAKWWD